MNLQQQQRRETARKKRTERDADRGKGNEKSCPAEPQPAPKDGMRHAVRGGWEGFEYSISTVSELYLGTRLLPNVPLAMHCWADATFLGGNLVPRYPLLGYCTETNKKACT